MPSYTATRFVKAHPNAAYAVAADVAAYKDFLPMLMHSTIRGPKQKQGKGETFMAELVVGYEKLGIRESFVSKVVTDPIARTVTATSSDGPMKALSASWAVKDAPGGSDVTVVIDYAFNSRMMQMAFAGVLDLAAAKLMSSFEQRAEAMAKTIV
jgi:coenzyme Q-binding protein COQ10